MHALEDEGHGPILQGPLNRAEAVRAGEIFRPKARPRFDDACAEFLVPRVEGALSRDPRQRLTDFRDDERRAKGQLFTYLGHADLTLPPRLQGARLGEEGFEWKSRHHSACGIHAASVLPAGPLAGVFP